VQSRTIFAALFALLAAWSALAQDKPADNMEIVREKMRADKKLLVADAMSLTESEAKGFWPVYDGYQKDLGALNSRTIKLVQDYAASYKSMDDKTAGRLLDDYLAIERDRLALMESYRPKFLAVIPETKVARYYQIENKIRAAVNYELAAGIPLVK
jgi:hypothetical protein